MSLIIIDEQKKYAFSNGEDVDLQLKSAIEGVVIKWVTQITEVLQETPSSVHKSLENPLPYAGKYPTLYPMASLYFRDKIFFVKYLAEKRTCAKKNKNIL